MNDHLARRRRTRRRWYLILGSLLVVNVVVFGAYAYLRSLHSAVVDEVTVAPEVDAALTDRVESSTEPIVFLVIGSDSREGLPEEWEDDYGDFGGQRADVIMLAQLLPDQGRVQLLSLPRDLRVDIPGRERAKLNAAYAYGGSELMVETVKASFAVPVHHYVEIDFAGFAAIVDEVGGVALDFPAPARDRKSGLSVEAGSQVLDGREALAYARSRSYEELRNGSWTFVEANDIGRTARQQQVVGAILAELVTPSIVVEAPGVVSSLARHMVVDSAFRELDFAGLAWGFRSFDRSAIDSATLPAEDRLIDGIAYLVPAEEEADRMLAAFRNGGSLTLVAGEAPPRVSVLNGNGADGLAGAWQAWLTDRGFEVVEVGDADGDYPVSQVVARRGGDELATELVGMLPFGEAVTGSVGAGADIVLVLGEDAEFPGEG
jgi:LCP family protein required for cell wall assembly